MWRSEHPGARASTGRRGGRAEQLVLPERGGRVVAAAGDGSIASSSRRSACRARRRALARRRGGAAPDDAAGSSSIRPPGPQPKVLLSGPVNASHLAAGGLEDQSRTSVKSSGQRPPAGTATSSTRASSKPGLRARTAGYVLPWRPSGSVSAYVPSAAAWRCGRVRAPVSKPAMPTVAPATGCPSSSVTLPDTPPLSLGRPGR